MNGRQYLKNQLPVLLVNLLGIITLSLFLLACGNSIQSILFLSCVWGAVVLLYLTVLYRRRKKYLENMLSMAEQLEERYIIPEVIKIPELSLIHI